MTPIAVLYGVFDVVFLTVDPLQTGFQQRRSGQVHTLILGSQLDGGSGIKELRVALAAARLKEELSLKKEQIRFFLHQFAEMDYTDIDCQKRLIKIFLNSVFVYDDKVVLTFNYSEDGKVLTLHEIDGGSGHSIRIPSGLVHHEKERSEKNALFSFPGTNADVQRTQASPPGEP